MTNLINDLSTLTTIPEKVLEKLFAKMYLVISDSVEEILLEEKDIASIDIGIGTLYIQVIDSSIKYKFIPSPILEKCVKDTVLNKQSLLRSELDTSLSNKIINTYKDFL